jgi:peptide/nickel transport system substrate-binding protein
MSQFCSWEAAAKDNKWQGRNITRWQSKEYDDVFKAAQGELDPVKRAALFIKMNDLVIADQVVIPVVYRRGAQGVANNLVCEMSGWDNNTWDLQNWFKQG